MVKVIIDMKNKDKESRIECEGRPLEVMSELCMVVTDIIDELLDDCPRDIEPTIRNSFIKTLEFAIMH